MAGLSFKYLASGSLTRKIRGQVDRTRRTIGKAVRDLWIAKLSTSRLSTRARARYTDAIKIYAPPRAGAYVQDAVAKLLETGWKRFDMKPGLLASSQYHRIPLSPGATIRTVSTKSSAASWVHPGFPGAKVAHRVARGTEKVIREVLSRVK